MIGQNEIDASYNLFEVLLNKAEQNSVLLMDKKGFVTIINKAFTHCFGYKEKDIIGKSASILYTPEDLESGLFERELERVNTVGRASDNNYLVNKDQSIVWVSGESLLIKNNKGDSCIFKVFQNINRIKVFEKDVQLLNDLHTIILSSIKDVVIVVDQKFDIIQVNDAFNNLFTKVTYSNSLLNFNELIKPYDPENYLRDDIQKVMNSMQGFTNRQVEIQMERGARSFEITCSPLSSFNQKNLLIVIHDITAYKQMEKEREDILDFVAHELRNPLSNVKLYNELMMERLKENENEQLINILNKNNNNVRRLNSMISELYEATKINAGYLNLNISEFNFEEVVKEAIDSIKGMHPEYNIIVKGDETVKLTADKDRLLQVIVNYLSNGVKYSSGSVNVVLTVTHDADILTVSVKDGGLGIPKEKLPFIFDRFFRAEKTMNIEGIGMGLYLCRQIISAHKGKLWAESEEGKGSTFYFSIPLNN